MSAHDRFACVVERPRGAVSVAAGFVCETVADGGGALEVLIAGTGEDAAGPRVEVQMVALVVTSGVPRAVGVDVAAPVELTPELRAEIDAVVGGAPEWEGAPRCLELVHEARARHTSMSIGPA
jgi:hypothetical protein